MNFSKVDSRIVALAMAQLADAVANSFLIVVMPLYIADPQIGGATFGLSDAAITGIILSAFGLTNFIVQPLAGRLSDRLGKRKIFIFSGLLLIAGFNVSYLLADNYLGILVIRIMQAASAALTIVGSIALVSELSPKDALGQNMGVYNSFRQVGFGAGPLLAGALISGGPYALFGGFEVTGFELSFYGAGIAGIISATMVGILVQDPENIEPANREESGIRVFAERPGQWLDPIFTLGLASLFMASCIALFSPIETIVNEHLGQGSFLFGVEFAAFIGTQALIQPFIGGFSDTYGHRRFIVLGLIGLVPATIIQGLVATPGQMIAIRLVQGLSAAMVFAPALALASDMTEEGKSGSQLSILTVSFALGISFGQFVSGFLVQFGYFVPFGAGALFAAIAAVLVYTQVDDDSKSRNINQDRAPEKFTSVEPDTLESS